MRLVLGVMGHPGSNLIRRELGHVRLALGVMGDLGSNLIRRELGHII